MSIPDRIMSLIVVADPAPLKAFYTESLAFELVTDKSGETGTGSFIIVAYATCAIGFCTPDALAELPGIAANAMVMLEVPQLAPVHRIMSERAPEVVGEQRDSPWGHYFDVTDPAGTRLRFIQVDVD
ncbi:MAG: hypothetical protein R3F39_02620 [Myxococcota bacterium]